MLELNKIYNTDCLEGMKQIPSSSVDLILSDLPYGLTQNEWDIEIDLDKLFIEYWRILKDNGIIVLTSQQPFTSKLVIHQLKYFRYELIWEKIRTSGFLNANRMPLKSHENILIFYKKSGTFNPQFTIGRKSHSKGKMRTEVNHNYGNYEKVDNADIHGDKKFPKSILSFIKVHPPIHPTQKPIALFEHLIKTYSNKGDLVLDGCMGSGTTAVAAKQLGRNFIGFEISKEYCDIANKRLEQKQLSEVTSDTKL